MVHQNSCIWFVLFYEYNIMNAWYRQFLEEILLAFIDDVPLTRRMQLMFQQDGIPQYNSDTVIDFLSGHCSLLGWVDYCAWTHCMASKTTFCGVIYKQ